MGFKILIDQDVFEDIMESSAWYEEQSSGLGERFKRQVKSQISLLKIGLEHGIRYNDVRCAQVPKFPFLIHYVVNESKREVSVFAVLHA